MSTSDSAAAVAPPTREQIDAAEAKAASICNLPHEEGAGCIKCNGLVTAELAGRLTSPVVRAEQSAESIGPKNTISDTCGSCEGSVAQHDVLRYHEGAQLPSPSERGTDAATYPTKEKEHPVAEPGKEQPFYGTGWAGRTAPDGTQVPQLAVCDFGYGHNAAPNARDSNAAPTPQQQVLAP